MGAYVCDTGPSHVTTTVTGQGQEEGPMPIGVWERFG